MNELEDTITRATTLVKQGDLNKAKVLFSRALEFDPENPIALLNLGVILFQEGDQNSGFKYLSQNFKNNPEDPVAILNYANALRLRDELEEAAIYYEKYLQKMPGDVSNLSLFIHILHETGDYQKAIYNTNELLKLSPENAEAQFAMANLRLLLGDFDNVWEQFSYRWKQISYAQDRSRYLTQPEWDFSDLENKTLILHAEMGVGDTIMYTRYFPLLAEKYLHSKIYIFVERHLRDLLTRCFENCRNLEFISVIPGEKMKINYDLHLPLMSLPQLFKTTLNTIPGNVPYLFADNPKKYIDSEEFVVGIAWYSKAGKRGKLRSIPLLELARFGDIPNITFVDLQYGDTTEERKFVKEKTGFTLIHDDSVEQENDLSDFTNQIEGCDLIISIDNSTVHVAGAMDKQVWTLLPYVPDYRWLLDRPDTPWYPSMRIFRQPARKQWEPVLKDLHTQLVAYAANCMSSK